MDVALYAKILHDRSLTDLKKLRYKYPDVRMEELIALFRESVHQSLPLEDFQGRALVYMEHLVQAPFGAVKRLLTPQDTRDASFGLNAMEREISATLTIESIDFSRDSVRKILQGYAPADRSEQRIFGLKKGLEFIADADSEITEHNLFTLYDLAVGLALDAENRLMPGAYYRHDSVFIMGQQIEHTGLPYQKLPAYMKKLAAFIRRDDSMDELLKAAVIHFYLAYLHPYFDGNGRMARLLQLWYLRRQGYPSAMFIPFSSYIERSRKQYYRAYTLVEENAKISGVTDITPFLLYFIEHVYRKIDEPFPPGDTLDAFRRVLKDGEITVKEKELWNYALSAYGTGEFSTKQLEKDFGRAAYATIRGFVMKFTELGLLTAQKYGGRVRYTVCRK